jgi:hypothetical protein
MSEKASELILALHDTLPTILEHFDTIERAELAQTLLDAMRQEYERTSTRLQNTKTELARADCFAGDKLHVIDYEAAKRLRDVTRQVAEKRAELFSIEKRAGDSSIQQGD